MMKTIAALAVALHIHSSARDLLSQAEDEYQSGKGPEQGVVQTAQWHSTQDEELREGEGHHHLSEEVRLFVPPVIEVAYSPHGQGQEHGQRCLCSRTAP